MINALLFLDGVFEFFGDLNLIIKIFAALMLASWVKNHVGGGPLGIILMGAVGWFVLFDGWALFGPIYVLYMLLMFGISGVIIDFFFINQGGPPEAEGIESPVSSGVDIQKRMHEHGGHAAMSAAQRIMRR